MNERWLAMEHYRLHRIESWPDSAYKEAALASARAAISMLGGTAHRCVECPKAEVLSFPVRPLPLRAAA